MFFMACDPSSSLGFGGMRPEPSTERFGKAPQGWSTSVSSAVPVSTSVTPTPGTRLKTSTSVGRRRSPSTTTTFSPAAAMVTARLAVTVDLPSACIELVTTMIRGGWSTSRKLRLVRSSRRASAMAPPAS